MEMYSRLVAIVWAVLIQHISCQTATRSLKIASTAKIDRVYVDGIAVTGVNFGASWSSSTIFAVPGSSRVLAVKFDSSKKPDAFIIADGSTSCGYYTSPATVKCVTKSSVSGVTNSWYLNTFIDSMWPSASVSSVASKVLQYPKRQFCQQANWMWTATPASVIYCRIRITPSVICPTLSLPNSVLNTTVTTFTTAVRVRCNEGYTIDRRNPLINSVDTVCTRNGTWSPFPISCQLILCRTLNVTNSVLNTNDTRFATTVRVHCNENYTIERRSPLINSIDTVCTRNGTWSPFPISCQRLRLAIVEGDSNEVEDIAQLNDQFFVVRYGIPKVFVYNATSFQFLREITVSNAGHRLRYLSASAVNNYLYVYGSGSQMLYRVDLSDMNPETNVRPLIKTLYSAYGLSVTNAGNIIMIDVKTNVFSMMYETYIYEYTPNGTIVRTLMFSNANTVYPISDLGNGVWLSITYESDNIMILLFNTTDGTIIKSFGTASPGSGLAEDLEEVYSLVVDAQGYILVAANNQQKIIVLNPSLTTARELPLPGITYQTFPGVLYLDSSSNRLYIGEGYDEDWSGSYRVLVVLDGVTNLGALFN